MSVFFRQGYIIFFSNEVMLTRSSMIPCKSAMFTRFCSIVSAVTQRHGIVFQRIVIHCHAIRRTDGHPDGGNA